MTEFGIHCSHEQVPPAEIDFPRYGHPGEGEQPQATPGEEAGAASSENVSETESH